MIVNPYVFGGAGGGSRLAGSLALRGIAPSLGVTIKPGARALALTGIAPPTTRLAVILKFGASTYTPPTGTVLLQFDNVPYASPVTT